MTASSPAAPCERLPAVVITTAALALPLVLPAGPLAVTFGVAVAVFAAVWTVVPLIDAPVDPVTAGFRGAAGVLAVLGGSLGAVATLGAASVPVLFTTFVAAALAWPLLARRRGHGPRNVDR